MLQMPFFENLNISDRNLDTFFLIIFILVLLFAILCAHSCIWCLSEVQFPRNMEAIEFFLNLNLLPIDSLHKYLKKNSPTSAGI